MIVRKLLGILLVLALFLQYRLWLGEGSYFQVRALRKEVALQQEKVNKLKERNLVLDAEVQDLKHHLDALEERARTDLGMVRKGETFYQYSSEHE